MSAASTVDQRIFLRSLYKDAVGQSISLGEALEAALTARFEDIKEGSVLVGTSGNGQSVTFSIPSRQSGLSPHETARLLEQQLTLFETTKSNLAGTPTDEEIRDAMLAQLVPIRSLSTDFTNIIK
jgi:hypothetical protein